LMVRSNFHSIPKESIYSLGSKGQLGPLIKSIGENGETISSKEFIPIDKIIHNRIIFKPFLAIDTAMLLVDMAITSPTIEADKESIIEKLKETIEKLDNDN